MGANVIRMVKSPKTGACLINNEEMVKSPKTGALAEQNKPNFEQFDVKNKLER